MLDAIRIGAVAWGLMAANDAWAVNFCVSIDVELSQEAGGDRWTDNAVDQAARGFTLEVHPSGGAAYEVVLSDGNSGPPAGCAALTLTSGTSYTMKVRAEGTIDGNDWIHHGASTITFLPFSYTGSGSTISRTIDGVTNVEFEQAVVIAFALNLHDGGTSGELFEIWNDAQQNHTNPAGELHLQENEDGKYTIAHEFGHLIEHRRAGPGDYPSPNNIDEEGCVGTGNGGISGIVTKKWQSNALHEGLGNFYSAATWNNRAQSSCGYVTNKSHNLDLEDTPEVLALGELDCWGDQDGLPYDYFDGEDWLDDLITANDSMGCTGALVNRSTTFDWMRYFWKLHHQGSGGQDVPMNEIFDVWNATTQTDWDPKGDTSTTSDDPWPRWNAAATATGAPFVSEHNASKGHVDH